MKEYIFILFTSVDCFHCKGMVGNGMMGNTKFFMKPTIIENILYKSDKIVFLNLHFSQNNGSYDSIYEISKFSMSGDKITQEIWTECNNNIIYKLICANKTSKTVKINQTKRLNTSWEKFRKEKIPTKIENYTYFYPCFFICKKDNWFNCIKNTKTELLGITNSGKTVQNVDGKIYLNNKEEGLNQLIMSPTELIEEAIDKGNLKVHIKNDF